MQHAPRIAVFRKDGMKEEPVKGEEVDADDDRFELTISAEPGANLANDRSPSRVRKTRGKFISPYIINVLSAIPVSVSVVRKKGSTLPEVRPAINTEIRSLMRDRVALPSQTFRTKGRSLCHSWRFWVWVLKSGFRQYGCTALGQTCRM